MGGACKNLEIYKDVSDKNGVKVGSWAIQKDSGLASCKLCPLATINFSRGKVNLTQHSEGKKHKLATESNQRGEGSRQPDIREALGEAQDDDIKIKAREFENHMVQACARHDVPPGVVECLTEVVKRHITDSEIVKRVKLCRTKVSYVTEFGLAATYEKDTVRKLRNCDAFSVAFDESEVNKKSEMAVIVKFSNEESGLDARYYKSIDLEAGDAETITESLLDAFTEDEIDFKKKLISADMDGCSTMQGHKTGVITRLIAEVPQMSSMGTAHWAAQMHTTSLMP